MRKLVRFILFTLFILLSCNKSEDPPNNSSENPTQEIPGDVNNDNSSDENEDDLVEVSINIELPAETPIKAEDLLISSLFTAPTNVVNSGGVIDVFNGNGFEVAFAENSLGQIVLMNYFNPLDSQNQKLSASTTAIALLMTHPWSINLSDSMRTTVLNDLNGISQYKDLVNAIESSLKDDVGILENEEVLLARETLISKLLDTLFDSDTLNSKSDLEKEPLAIEAENSTITLINRNSSMAYGIMMNDKQEIRLEGVNKKIFNNDSFDEQKINLSAVNDNQYSINTGTGLSLNASQAGMDVRAYNMGRITLGLLSTLTNVIDFTSSGDECIKSVGAFVLNRNNEVLNIAFIENRKSLSDAIIETLTNSVLDFEQVFKNCYNIELPEGRLKKLLSAYKFLTSIESKLEFGFLIADWLRFDSEIEFCTDKIDGKFQDCKPLIIIGELNYGKIPVGIGVQRMLTLENRSEEAITLTQISFPNQSFSTSPEISNLEIKQGESIELEVRFGSFTVGEELMGNVKIETDLPNENLFEFAVSGEVINPLEFESELVFGTTVLNTAESQSITVNNVSDYNVILNAPDSPEEGFSYNWSEQSIPAGGDIALEFTFLPLESKIYDTSVFLNNESTQENTKLKLIGTGIGSVLELSIEGNNYDFGQVAVNTEATKVLSIKNNSSQSVVITEIGDMDIFFVDKTNLSIQPGATKQVLITFLPKEAILYQETIPIITDAVENLQISITGEGVESSGMIAGHPDICPLDNPTPDQVPCPNGYSEFHIISNFYELGRCIDSFLFTENGKIIFDNPNDYVTNESFYSIIGSSLNFSITFSRESTSNNGDTENYSTWTYIFNGERNENGVFIGVMNYEFYYKNTYNTGVRAGTLDECGGTATWPSSVELP